MIPALLFEKVTAEREGSVRCRLCAHNCLIAEGKTGICRVRKNIGGELFSLNSDRLTAAHIDPIEKKPLYHFLPASRSFSIAAMGCNFSCRFCQNYSISQVRDEATIVGEPVAAEALVQQALQSDSRSISYTYTEPTIFFELMLATARLARAAGLRNVMVSNGYFSAAALDMIAPYLDGANIDLKAFSDDFYRRRCGATLEPVLDSIRRLRQRGIWVEVTTLLIPGLNSDEQELTRLASFLASVDPDMPWHVSRFFPQHRLLTLPPTPTALIERALEIGREKGLHFLYSGNVAPDRWSHTYCPSCGKILIERHGYDVHVRGLADGACRSCHAVIAGIWN